MKYSKAQLNAISKSYSERNKRDQERELDERGLRDIWTHQTIYKSLRAFLLAGDERLAECKESAIIALSDKLAFWDRLGQTTHDGYNECKNALGRIMQEAL